MLSHKYCIHLKDDTYHTKKKRKENDEKKISKFYAFKSLKSVETASKAVFMFFGILLGLLTTQ